MKTNFTCCNNCTERYTACHDSCVKRIAEKLADDIQKIAIQREKKKDVDIRTVEFASISRAIKLRNQHRQTKYGMPSR